MNESTGRRELAEVGRLLYERDLLVSRDGNLSILLDSNRILTTPAGVCKGRIGPEDFTLVDANGGPLPDQSRPSTEIKMHLSVYRMRKDVTAIIHAHPPFATAFAVAGVAMDKAALAEVVYNLGVVPVAEYALPSTSELADIIGQYILHYQALLLANHGVLAVGEDIWDAYYRMEGVEHFARILLYAGLLGGPKELSPEQVGQLCALRREAGVSTPNPLCDSQRCHGTPASSGSVPAAEPVGTARACSPPAPEASPHPPPADGEPPAEFVENVVREVLTQLRTHLGRSRGNAAW